MFQGPLVPAAAPPSQTARDHGGHGSISIPSSEGSGREEHTTVQQNIFSRYPFFAFGCVLCQHRPKRREQLPVGPMDKASASGAEDSGFESLAGNFFFFFFFFPKEEKEKEREIFFLVNT